MARKILLADDSVTAQNMGRRILSDAGYEVITVNNGSAALKKIAEVVPDIIVLDVYMPGYGGLEVCQRLKETQATSRIPVLITVGKLEPFKAEEARRVRADAHIVKPFDATELLAAIMRLEDKIVPQPAVFKGRGAKTDAPTPRKGRDRSIDPGSETSMGWRRRLSVPKNSPPVEEAEASSAKARSTAFQDLSRKDEPKTEEPKSKDTPAAITPSEDGPKTETVGKEEKVSDARPFENFGAEHIAVAEAPTTSVEVTQRTGSESESNSDAVVNGAAKVSSEDTSPKVAAENTEPIVIAEPLTADETEAPPVVEAASLEVEATPAVKAEKSRHENTPSEDEVMAALASLSAFGESPKPAVGTAPVLAGALAAVATVYSGPRWIAEPVALSNGDSHLILETEMEKAYSAFAAVESAANAVSPASVEEIPLSDCIVPAAAELPSDGSKAQGDTKTPEPESVLTTGEARDTETPLASSAESRSQEAAVKAEAPAPVDAISVPGPEEPQEAKVDEVSSVGFREIAFAAAASASASASAGAHTVETVKPEVSSFAVEAPAELSAEIASVADSVSLNEISEIQNLAVGASTIDEAEVKDHESQLASAWQNWKQIRESVGSTQTPTSDNADAGFKQIRDEESARTPEDNHPTAAADASLVANIVDSVFAEFRPRLIEEVVKRLAEARK